MRVTTIPLIPEQVSVVGFGCWALSGPGVWTGGRDEDTIAAVRRAVDLGISFFDVAPVYGLGHAERVLGRALAGMRTEVLIATKCGLVWNQAEEVRNDLTGPSLRREIDESLRRLGTEYIDLYQMHWPDPDTPVEDTMEVLLEIKEAGKIRHIGVSNFSIDLTSAALATGEVATFQGLMNMLEPSADTYHGIPLEYRSRDEVLPFVVRHDMAFLPYSPLLQGLLTDSYDPAEVGGADVRRENPALFGDEAQTNLATADRLRATAREMGRPLEQLAINWLAAMPGMGPVIAGAQDVGQLEVNAGAGTWELSDDERRAIEEVLATA